MRLGIPTYRKQQLLLDFASLKHDPIPGLYMSLTPGDPTLWSGVLFVRKGPYAPAPLRFQVSFPVSTTEENLPPLVTFSTDIFHPLVVPLTTYTFSTALTFSPVQRGQQDTVSATDEERLPPGGYSFRHGFPEWFGRKERRSVSGSSAGAASDAGKSDNTKGSIPIKLLLQYIKSTFDDEDVLDSIPLEAAGNPGAWHAWKTYHDGQPQTRSSIEATAAPNSPTKSTGPKQPAQWNWEGVFEKRVRSGIDASLSDQVLFGTKGSAVDNDVIRFSNLDDETLKALQAQLVG